MLLYIGVLGILCNVQCNNNNPGSSCVYNPVDGEYYFENVRTFFIAFAQYWNIAFTVIINLFLVAAYNFFG